LFFTGLSEEERKSISSLSIKLASCIEEKESLTKKVVGLEYKRKELELEVQKMNERRQLQDEQISKLKNENSAFLNRIDYWKYLIDESKKEKQILYKEKEDLMARIEQIRSLNEVIEMVEQA